MLSFNPKIYALTYPNGTKYWLVKAQMPGGGKPHQSKHATEADAIKERNRLLQEFSGGGLSPEQSKALRLAQYRLDTCSGDARGKTVLDAVEHYILHFKDHTHSPTVKEGIKAFRELHVINKRPDTIEEYDRYLPRLEERFGAFKQTEMTRDVLSAHVAAYPSPLNHRKCLVSLFSFLSGTSKRLKNPNPCLAKNEALWIPMPPKGDDKEVVILRLEEVKNLIVLAIIYGDLPFWIWCLFTGMRPCETKRFWTRPGYGWDRINLSGNVIRVNSEISKTHEFRKIIIRPNLKKWLLLFKEADVRMYPSGHRLKFRAVKADLLSSEKAEVNDLLRHTSISFRVAAFDKSKAATALESGNSEKMIDKHYFEIVNDQAEIDGFWGLTPSSFGFPEIDMHKLLADMSDTDQGVEDEGE